MKLLLLDDFSHISASLQDVAVAGDGSIVVVDCDNHRVRLISPFGKVTTIAGTFLLHEKDT